MSHELTAEEEDTPIVYHATRWKRMTHLHDREWIFGIVRSLQAIADVKVGFSDLAKPRHLSLIVF